MGMWNKIMNYFSRLCGTNLPVRLRASSSAWLAPRSASSSPNLPVLSRRLRISSWGNQMYMHCILHNWFPRWFNLIVMTELKTTTGVILLPFHHILNPGILLPCNLIPLYNLLLIYPFYSPIPPLPPSHPSSLLWSTLSVANGTMFLVVCGKPYHGPGCL